MLVGFGVLGVAFFMARANRSADRWRSSASCTRRFTVLSVFSLCLGVGAVIDLLTMIERMMMTPVALLSGLQGGFVEGKLGIGARQLYIKEKRGAARRA